VEEWSTSRGPGVSSSKGETARGWPVREGGYFAKEGPRKRQNLGRGIDHRDTSSRPNTCEEVKEGDRTGMGEVGR